MELFSSANGANSQHFTLTNIPFTEWFRPEKSFTAKLSPDEKLHYKETIVMVNKKLQTVL